MFVSTNFCIKERVSIAVFSPSELRDATSPCKQWRTEGGGFGGSNSEGPPKSSQTQPDFENC